VGESVLEVLTLPSDLSVKAVVGLGNLTLSDGVWADPQRRLSVQ
jgi:hypothetical protein